jgi:hypothetical protein
MQSIRVVPDQPVPPDYLHSARWQRSRQLS